MSKNNLKFQHLNSGFEKYYRVNTQISEYEIDPEELTLDDYEKSEFISK